MFDKRHKYLLSFVIVLCNLYAVIILHSAFAQESAQTNELSANDVKVLKRHLLDMEEVILKQQEQIRSQQEQIQTIKKFIETVTTRTAPSINEENNHIDKEENKPIFEAYSLSDKDAQEPPGKTQETIEEPLKNGTPAVSTETQQRDISLRPPPVGSYKDLEQTSGGIDNLRKYDYKNVFSTLDSVLKHSERLSIGLVALKVQYNADETEHAVQGRTLDTADEQNTIRDENGFRIRAAELYVTGRLTPWSTYYTEIDFARQKEIPLNCMYLDFYTNDMAGLNGLDPYVSQIRMGQFREPFGIEQGSSQGLLDFIDRAYYTDLKTDIGSVDAADGDPTLNPFGKDNGTGFMQQLDMGVELMSKFPQLPWRPELQVAVINGAGRNYFDNNGGKDFSGRWIFHPMPGLNFCVAGYAGTALFTAPNKATADLPLNSTVQRIRGGMMYTYIPPQLPELKLQGEYIEGTDNDFHRRTWYQYALYRPFSWLPAFEPAYRYEEFTIDTDRPNSTLSRHTIGFNYYLHTNAKFTANYEIRHDENGGGDTNANNNNFFTTQMQFRF